MVLCAGKMRISYWTIFSNVFFEKVKEWYENKFKDSVVVNKSGIKWIVEHFQTEWTVEPKRKKRPSYVLTNHKMKEIVTKINEKLAMSVTKLALKTDFHRTTAYHTLKLLKVHAYRATLVQVLNAPGLVHRLKIWHCLKLLFENMTLVFLIGCF